MSVAVEYFDANMTREIKGRLLKNETLSKYTSWRVGGPAEQLFIPADRDDLVNFLACLPETEPVFWIGLGSNLLVRDGGIRGTVINTRGTLKQIKIIEDDRVYVEAGVPCARVARFCAEQGLTGAEFLAGIPGTMGGALKMNAGAFGGETWSHIESVEIVNKRGVVENRKANQFCVNYRSVSGLIKEWFLAATLRLDRGSAVISQHKIRELLAKRAQTQPTNQPTCGSVFKNPPGDFAARLIEVSGLKGYSIGGAVVSEKHANFIVNCGTAKAAHIEALIEYIQEQVLRQQGVLLQTEVCKVGEWL